MPSVLRRGQNLAILGFSADLETMGCRQLRAGGACLKRPAQPMRPDLASATRDHFDNQIKSITSEESRPSVETSSIDKLKNINRKVREFPEMKNRYNSSRACTRNTRRTEGIHVLEVQPAPNRRERADASRSILSAHRRAEPNAIIAPGDLEPGTKETRAKIQVVRKSGEGYGKDQD